MKYTPISISPEQAQFLQTRKFQINEIARIFRVPPHMVGDLEKSSFSNIEQQSLEFVKYTLDPWVIRWEQALSRALLASDEKQTHFFRFNVEGLLRGDYQSRMGRVCHRAPERLDECQRYPNTGGHGSHYRRGRREPLPHQRKHAPPLSGRGIRRQGYQHIPGGE